MVSCDTRISGSPANWTFSMALICSGDQRSASRAWTQPRSRSFPASFAVFGRRARNSACACAATARYPPCRGLLRRISRLTVDGARPSRAAITRSGSPAATPTAISSRSATDRYRPPAGPGPLPFTPPAARNQASAARPAPAATAASRHGSPARTASQKTSRSARGTGSRPRLTNTTTSTISRNRCNHQLNPPSNTRVIIKGSAAQVRALQILAAQQLGGGTLEHDLPRRQDVAAVCDRQGHGGVLLDHQHRHARLVNLPDDLEVLLHERRREAHRRLVHEQQARPRHQRATHGDHLLLAAGQRAAQLMA